MEETREEYDKRPWIEKEFAPPSADAAYLNPDTSTPIVMRVKKKNEGGWPSGVGTDNLSKISPTHRYAQARHLRDHQHHHHSR